MSLGLRLRLSTMMFLQYAVWSIWLSMLAQRLGPNDLKLTEREIGWIFTVYGFGAILGPFFLGQLADRFFATERILGVAHLVGGVLLVAAGYARTFVPIFLLLFLYCNLYMPTMGLTNSLTFRSLGEAHQDRFPGIRLWGTIGWIAASLAFGAYLGSRDVAALQPLFRRVGPPAFRDCFRVAGVVSWLYGLYCFTLPHTPPMAAKPADPSDRKSAIRESLGLMRHRSFAVLVGVAGLIGVMLAFYFACENFFLEHIGTDPRYTGSYMTIGQVAEIVAMMLVPAAVRTLGVKRTMILGAGAWALRFGLSMVGQPWWLMIASIGLHGVCFGFFFVVAQMYVDRAAAPDIKATAQNFLIFVIYGLGTILGSVLTGEIRGVFKDDWTRIWAGPFALTLVGILAFALLFREDEIRKPVPEPVAA